MCEKRLNVPCDSVMEQIMKFVYAWESQFPEEEMVVLTLPKYNYEERERVISAAVEFLRNEKFVKCEKSEFNENAENTLKIL